MTFFIFTLVMQRKKAIVIGAGIAGLAVAIRLQHQDFEVAVFEANSYPGGKLSEIRKNGFRFDAGPSLFTMPQFVEELFELSGKDITDYFQYEKKSVVCNYFYEDGTQFTAYADIQKFAKEAAKVFDVEASTILTYLLSSQQKYELTAPLFLEKSLHKLSTYWSKKTIKALSQIRKLGIDRTLHQENKHVFEDARLVQFFDRFATYNGSDPYQTPGIMSMIPHLEQYFGTYFPKGGMHSITKSLFRLAKEIGVTFSFDTKVEKIIVEKSKAIGVEIGEQKYEADIVVNNMDVVPAYRKLLKDQKQPEKTLQQERSSSALIFYWGVSKSFPNLDLHNIFFASDYRKEFAAIFDQKKVYQDPTVYVNISSKNEASDAPEGSENWFVMINVPSNQGQDWDHIISVSRSNIQKKLSRILKVDISELIVSESILDPRSIESKTQSYQGALYGAASNDKFAAFLRHPNFSQRIKNLYFCGGSVHPGGGIPLCLLSGKIVAALVEQSNVIKS